MEVRFREVQLGKTMRCYCFEANIIIHFQDIHFHTSNAFLFSISIFTVSRDAVGHGLPRLLEAD